MNAQFRVNPHITDASQEPVDMAAVKQFHNHGGDSDGAGVTAVVMDSGIDTTHNVFSNVSIRAPDPNGLGSGDAVGHGTGVAGLIVQLAPAIDEIIDLRIFGSSGRTDYTNIKTAYEWLFDHAGEFDVVNMSWGATKAVPEIDSMQNKLINMGVRDVTAAGNTGKRGGSPATAEKAFGIGACTINGDVTQFSSYNPRRDNPDVAALGKNIKLPRATDTSMGQVIDGNWVMASGTSFAAPITTGYVCRYLNEKQSTPAKRFESTARDIAGTPEDGEGIVDYTAALGKQDGNSSTEAIVENSPFAKHDCIYIDDDLIADGRYKIDGDKLTAVFEDSE